MVDYCTNCSEGSYDIKSTRIDYSSAMGYQPPKYQMGNEFDPLKYIHGKRLL
ncbi:hypothetical protein HOE07_04190 [archaeon]|nr:hypothetical protein [archaeon]